MYVQSDSNASALLELYRQKVAAGAVAAAEPASGSPAKAGTSSTTGTRAATGSLATSRLSSQVLGHLLDQGQRAIPVQGESEPSSTNAASSQTTGDASDATATNLQIGMKDEMNDIANNPAEATSYAKILAGNATPLSSINDYIYGSSYAKQIDDATSYLSPINSQRTALYNSQVASGSKPADICLDLLKFNISQPSSYYQALDPGNIMKNEPSPLDNYKSMLSTLQGDMATAASDKDMPQAGAGQAT